MTLQPVQCPQCGAPVTASNLGNLVQCKACGSTLQIKAGASGFPLAKLIALKQDTGFIAKREAATRLKEQLRELEVSRDNAEYKTQPEFFPFPAIFLIACGALPALLGLGILLFGDDAGQGFLVLGASLAPGAIAYFLAKLAHDAKVQGLREQYGPVVEKLNGEIDPLKSQLVRLEAELDDLTKRV